MTGMTIYHWYRCVVIGILLSLLMPVVALAQNICEVADAECPADMGADTGMVPCACPILGIATIAGVCIGPSKCQETAIIPTPTTATLLVGGGLAASTLVSMLMSAGGGSGGSGGSYGSTADSSLYGGTASQLPSSFYSGQTSSAGVPQGPVGSTAFTDWFSNAEPTPTPLCQLIATC